MRLDLFDKLKYSMRDLLSDLTMPDP